MIHKKIKILMVLAVIMLPIYRVNADSGGCAMEFYVITEIKLYNI